MSELQVREALPEDLPALTGIYNYYVREDHATFDLVEFTVEQRQAWFERFSTAGRYRLLVGTVEGKLVGYASSLPLRPKPAYDQSVETTVYLDPVSVGKAYGERIYSELMALLEGRDDVHRAYGVIAMPNAGSVALHEKLGFSQIGTMNEVGFKFGRYWDTAWFEKRFR